MILQLMALDFSVRIYSLRQIRASFAEIFELVNKLFLYIAKFNRLPEDRKFLGDYLTSQYEIPTSFKDFVDPNSVRLVKGDRRYPNLLTDSSFLESSLPKGINIETLYSNYLNNLPEVEKKGGSTKIVVKEDIDSFEPSVPDFNNVVSRLYSIKKDRNPATITLESLREDLALMDIIDRVAVNECVEYTENNPQIPILLNEDGMDAVSKIVGEYVCTTKVSRVLREYPKQNWNLNV